LVSPWKKNKTGEKKERRWGRKTFPGEGRGGRGEGGGELLFGKQRIKKKEEHEKGGPEGGEKRKGMKKEQEREEDRFPPAYAQGGPRRGGQKGLTPKKKGGEEKKGEAFPLGREKEQSCCPIQKTVSSRHGTE